MRSAHIFHGYALYPSLREEGQDAWRRKWRTTEGKKGHLKFFMDETEQRATTSRSAFNSKGSYKCFGFGFNGFEQLSAHKTANKDNETSQFQPTSIAGVTPSPVPLNVDCVSSIVGSWSCSFYLKGWRYGELWF